MKWILHLGLLAMVSGAVSKDAVETDDGREVTDVRISIDRLAIMNERTQTIWQKMRAEVQRSSYDDPVVMNSALRGAVWEFNQLRENLCGDRFMVDKTCGAPFLPAWVYESPKAVPSLQELDRREGELEALIVPLWDAACERLRKVIPYEDSQEYCSIE